MGATISVGGHEIRVPDEVAEAIESGSVDINGTAFKSAPKATKKAASKDDE